jgi:hypothetical protein
VLFLTYKLIRPKNLKMASKKPRMKDRRCISTSSSAKAYLSCWIETKVNLLDNSAEVEEEDNKEVATAAVLIEVVINKEAAEAVVLEAEVVASGDRTHDIDLI